MIGYISICQHFHQPHFQLQNTREKVYNLSYLPWINLLESMSKSDGFYINMHFSGPFLYWLKCEKKEYVYRLKKLIESGKIGIVGGFADEAFIQLSTRVDDIAFQIKEYEKLTKEMFDITASEWQGFHIPERECGEYLIKEITKTLSRINAIPIYYLDSETFFTCHYSESGGEADYCKKLFGMNDPVSKTTISHFPKSLLQFAFRDHIGNNDFICVPIHCEERYWFLKCEQDIGMKPADYLMKLKQKLREAKQQAQNIGKEQLPIVVVFEDAEKFGDWSGQPDKDSAWLNELVELIVADDDVQLTGLKDYYDTIGCIDTYPIRTSHSYIEWENWTAQRGIRGVVYSDEKIRKTIARLQMLEYRIDQLEKKLIEKYIDTQNPRLFKAILDSSERFDYVFELISLNMGLECSDIYYFINRIRNLMYQEDSKWAIRHPNYGSAPYFDNMGICLLEVADRMISNLFCIIEGKKEENEILIEDWMKDFVKRIFISTEHQTISISTCGAAVDYHVALNNKLSKNEVIDKVVADVRTMNTYPSIYRFVSPIAFIETDSALCHMFDNCGGRNERCRNSFVLCLLRKTQNAYECVASFDKTLFELDKYNKTKHGYSIDYNAEQEINIDGISATVKIIRRYNVCDTDITVESFVEMDSTINLDLYLGTMVATSLTASDEVKFSPTAGIEIKKGENSVNFSVNNITNSNTSKTFSAKTNGTIEYLYKIETGANDVFINGIRFAVSSSTKIEHIQVLPAVSSYYENFVGREQSKLGYTSSGMMLTPVVKIADGKADMTINQMCLWDIGQLNSETFISLIE